VKINISYDSDKPMYEQIKDSIIKSILNGELKSNEALPSVRQLAKDLNVSMITTKRAYFELELAGFVYTVSGKGTFVRLESLDKARESKKMQMLDALSQTFSEMKSAGIKKYEIEQKLNETYGGEEQNV